MTKPGTRDPAPGPTRWVSGATLNAMPTVDTDDNDRLKADIARAFGENDHPEPES